jgi:hypothetical protein
VSAKTSAPTRSTLAIDARTLSEPVFPLDDTQQKQSPESSAPAMTPNSAFGRPRLPDPPPYLGVDVHWKVTQMVIGQRAPWSSGIEQIGRGMAVSQASGARPELCFPSGRGLWQEPPGRRKGA